MDTIGTLYDCCGNFLTEVDDYAPCGKINFRIIYNLTEGNTYYVKVGVFGDDTGSYTLRVTERVFANYVNINKTTITLEKGVTYELPITPNYTYKGYNGAQRIPGLSVSIDPSNANEQKIWWWEQYGSVLDCSYGWDDDGDRYIHVTATGIGTTKLYAQDWNENGKRDECTVYVGGAPVTGISLDRTTKTVSLNDTEQVTAIIAPQNALNKGVTWDSSNWNVVDVDSNGVITGLRVGTATISATTDEGGYRATCIVTVDKREKVTVKKDDHSFYVTFADGKVWKNIGIDLSNRQENYNQMYPPNMWYENYEYLIEEEQRYFDNIYVEENGVMEYKTYSVKQIAYLYLLDPVGIEYYMRNHACHDKDIMSGEFLSYKDEVYEAIFGNSERLSGRFYFTIVDGSVRYGRYSGAKRTDVYSNEEIIFGSHTIFNWSSFWQSIGETIFENIPVISHILLGVEMYQALFYSGSIVSAMSGVASEFLDDYAKETENTVLEKMLGWPKTVFDCFTALADALVGAFELNNLKDMDIYAKIQEQDYRTVFDRYGSELTIQEIISKCTNA